MKAPFFSCAALVLILASCASTRIGSDNPDLRPRFESPMPVSVELDPSKVRKLWSRKLRGYVSDLNVSADGKAVLAATLPDYDREGGTRKNLVHYLSSRGKEVWKKEVSTQVKSQAISRDGKLVLVATHDDEIQAFSAGGKRLWSIEAGCSPLLLDALQKMICYHDDDAEPGVAFDVYDLKGKLLSSYPIQDDALALKASPDGRSLAIALNHGQVVFFGSDLKVKWQAKVSGEIADLDLSAGENPRVAVLYSVRSGEQKLSLIDSRGQQIADVAVGGHLDQVVWGSDAGVVFGYGNGESGQYVSGFSPIGPDLRELWRKGAQRNAHYTPVVSSFPEKTGTQVILGFEQVSDSSRQSYILSLASSGAANWAFPVAESLKSEEGSYLYLESGAPEAGILAVATDEGSLGLYRIEPQKHRSKK